MANQKPSATGLDLTQGVALSDFVDGRAGWPSRRRGSAARAERRRNIRHRRALYALSRSARRRHCRSIMSGMLSNGTKSRSTALFNPRIACCATSATAVCSLSRRYSATSRACRPSSRWSRPSRNSALVVDGLRAAESSRSRSCAEKCILFEIFAAAPFVSLWHKTDMPW